MADLFIKYFGKDSDKIINPIFLFAKRNKVIENIITIGNYKNENNDIKIMDKKIPEHSVVIIVEKDLDITIFNPTKKDIVIRYHDPGIEFFPVESKVMAPGKKLKIPLKALMKLRKKSKYFFTISIPKKKPSPVGKNEYSFTIVKE